MKMRRVGCVSRKEEMKSISIFFSQTTKPNVIVKKKNAHIVIPISNCFFFAVAAIVVVFSFRFVSIHFVKDV